MEIGIKYKINAYKCRSYGILHQVRKLYLFQVIVHLIWQQSSGTSQDVNYLLWSMGVFKSLWELFLTVTSFARSIHWHPPGNNQISLKKHLNLWLVYQCYQGTNRAYITASLQQRPWMFQFRECLPLPTSLLPYMYLGLFCSSTCAITCLAPESLMLVGG